MFVRVLSYSQILSTLRRGKVVLNGIEYLASRAIQDFIDANVPASGEVFVGGHLLVAKYDPNDGPVIVAFAPGGPPDPG